MSQEFVKNNEWEIENINGWEDFSGIRIINGDFYLLLISLDNGLWIKCTSDHRLFKDVNEEICAKDVKIGMKLLTINGLHTVVNIQQTFSTVVYDFVNTDSGTVVTNRCNKS